MVTHRTDNELVVGSGRYTHAAVMALDPTSEAKIEHRNLCKKERLKSPFALPKVSSDFKGTLNEIDSYFLIERNFSKVLNDLGVANPFANLVKNGRDVVDKTEDLAAWNGTNDAGRRALGLLAIPVIPALDTVNIFDITETISQEEVEGSNYYYNTLDEPKNFQINFVTKDMLLNNTKADLRKKVEVQSEGIVNNNQGGALTLWLIRKAVVRASEKHVESIKSALKQLKLSQFIGENIDEIVRIMRNNMSVLEAAGQVPNTIVKQLMDIFMTSSNKSFNQVFETWHLGTIVHGLTPTYGDVLDKAVEVYSTLCDDKKWSKSRLKDSSFLSGAKYGDDSDVEGEDDKSASNGSSDNESEPSSEQLEKRKKNRARRKKQKARKQANAAAARIANGNDAQVETAAAASGGRQGGHDSDEIIRTFTMDRVELRGNIKKPPPGEEHKKRAFKRTDNNETVELYWCWTCGNRGGMWKKHATRDCPFLQRGRDSSPANSDRSDPRQVRFGPSAGIASLNHPSEIRDI